MKKPPSDQGFCCTRRELFLLAAAAACLCFVGPGQALASPVPVKHLIVINARGGMDTLHAIIPYSSPYIRQLRGGLLPGAVGTPGGMIDVGSGFAVHPVMPNLANMLRGGDALVVHAVGNFANDRSHFQAQDFLSCGAPELLASGWMNRAVPFISGGAIQSGITFGLESAAAMQGPSLVAGWAPNPFGVVSQTFLQTLQGLNSIDPMISPAMNVSMADLGFLAPYQFNAPPGSGPVTSIGSVAGAVLANNAAPTIAYIDMIGLDTHIDQIAKFASFGADLDAGLAILKTSLGAAWGNTVIMVMTEFGRTAAENGCGGTDHGTAFSMILAGGAVSNVSFAGQFPGLGPTQLYQSRDLAPTVDFAAVVMGILRDHLGLSPTALASIFPDSAGVSPMSGLIGGGA